MANSEPLQLNYGGFYETNDSDQILEKAFAFSENEPPLSVSEYRTEHAKTEANNMNDKEIVRLFFERDERAIAEAHAKYGKYCTAVALNILKNREDSEACVNDALMKAWNAIPPEQPRNLAGFLAKITKNICLNAYDLSHAEKRGGGEIPLIFDELSECIPDGSNVEKAFEQKELGDTVNKFLKTLPESKRNLFILRYWYCLSVSEAAQRSGFTESNAAVTLLRIRKKLLGYLRKRGY